MSLEQMADQGVFNLPQQKRIHRNVAAIGVPHVEKHHLAKSSQPRIVCSKKIFQHRHGCQVDILFGEILELLRIEIKRKDLRRKIGLGAKVRVRRHKTEGSRSHYVSDSSSLAYAGTRPKSLDDVGEDCQWQMVRYVLSSG